MIRLLAIVDAGALPGEPSLRIGRLDLVFSPGAVAPPDERGLRAHDAAVRSLFDRVDALLPAGFGVVLPERNMLDRLAPREEELAAALERVRGHEQVTVRVFGEPAPVRSGAEFLRSRAQVPGLPAIRALAGELVRAERQKPGGRAPLLGSVYHLVPRGSAAAYRARVDGAHEGRRLSVRGPFPPYAFAEPAR